MKIKRFWPEFWISGLISIIVLASLLGCSSQAGSLAPTSTPAVNTIKIGVMLPLTGVNGSLGQSLQQAIALALDMEGGQVAGRPIRLIIEDEGDQGPAAALDKARKLVESDKIDVMLGPFQPGFASAILPYLGSIPIVDVKFTAPLSNEETKNAYSFWTAPRFQDYTYPLGIYAADQGLKTAASIGSDSPEGTAYTEGFVYGFQNSGGKLTQQQWVPITNTEFSTQISYLRTADTVICAILGDNFKTTFLKEYEQADLQGMPVILLEPNSLSTDSLKGLGQEFAGTLAIQGYTPSLGNPENLKFVQAYQAKYNSLPDNQICEAYNGMRVLIEGLRATQGDTSPDKLRQALQNTQLDLPTGQFKFSQARTGLQPLRVVSLQPGTGALQWVVEKEFPAVDYYHPPTP